MQLPDSYIVLDTETTGLHRTARMIELAAVKVIDRQIIDQRSQFCNPGIALPYGITRLTGITDLMLTGRASASQVLPKFLNFTDGLPVVGHNVRFDLGILRYEASLAGIVLPRFECWDTLLLARRQVDGLPSYSLHALVDYFHIHEQPAHRALADVYATQALFERLRSMQPS